MSSPMNPAACTSTFLDDDGRKLGRKMLGRAKQAAVKLDPNDSVTFGLVIGEGIRRLALLRAARRSAARLVPRLGRRD